MADALPETKYTFNRRNAMNTHGGYTGPNKEMIDFSVNINPIGMPAGLKFDLVAALDGLGKYPDISGEVQRAQIAGHLGVSADNIILGNGAIDIIYLYARAFADADRPALIIAPTFNEYHRALLVAGWNQITEIPFTEKDEFRINPEALIKMIHEVKPHTVFLCNPNNPTGVAYSPDYLGHIFERVGRQVHWFIDESFIDFSSKGSCLDLMMARDLPMVLLRSMTKFYGLPGLRVGYAVGREDLIDALAGEQMPWAVNHLALSVIDTLLSDRKFSEQSKAFMKAERRRVFLELSKIKGIKVYPSSANFHLCALKSGTAAALNAGLNHCGINIRTCEDFAGLDEKFFRIAVRKKEENDKLIAVLSDMVE